MSSLHISASKGDIAKTVLMPGDPLRANVMSKKFLKEAKPINTIRNMLGFTGYYKDAPVTIMGSGMGVPSIGIYSHELFDYYGVERIIRVGTCGSIQPDFEFGDIILAQAVSTDSNYLHQYNLPGSFAPTASWNLLKKASDYCIDNHLKYHAGNVLCSDVFYHHDSSSWKSWASLNVLCIEMESVALYANAALANAEALTVLTVADKIPQGERSSSEDRESAFSRMFEIALACVLS